MTYRQAGFTLPELLIVVGIIGMLGTFALPAYQDYAIRARVSEGLSLASEAKSTVADNAMLATPAAGGGLGAGLSTGPGTSCMTPGVCVYPAATANVATIAIDTANGEVTITFTPRAAPAGRNVLLLIPSVEGAPLVAGTPPLAPLLWTCYSAGRPGAPAAATLSGKHVPPECRG